MSAQQVADLRRVEEVINEWRKGCSVAQPDHPGTCEACTDAAWMAVLRVVNAGAARELEAERAAIVRVSVQGR